MIEVTLREYLENELNVPVYMEVPKSIPASYVLLQLIDAGRIDHIDAATFNVIVKGDTLYSAAELRDEVKAALLNSITLNGISHVDQGGEIAGIDSANKTYQYELTFNFYFYKEET